MKKFYFSKISFSGLCLGIIGVLISFNACNRDDSEFEKPKEIQSDLSQQDGDIIKLGKKLENPYTVENMGRALESLKENGQLKSGIDIYTTHLYVRFLPKDSTEFDLLLQDTTLDFYDYPLDYEISEEGNNYHDPEIPKDKPTWQYTVVKPDYVFPNMEYQVLSELFMPEEEDDEDDEGNTKSASDLQNALDALEDEAYRITGNEDEDNEDTSTVTTLKRRRKWRPDGYIRVYDDTKGSNVPVEGVKVLARRFTKKRRAITNHYGYFKTGRFRRSVRYKVFWKRHDFSIRRRTYQLAVHKGPKQKSRWTWNISKDSHQGFYATIFRAAHHYYYKNIKGLRRPPQNKTFRTKLKIRARYVENPDKNGSHKPSRRFLGLGSAIKIYNPQHTSKKIYGTVIHELAHASHWAMDSWNYRNSPRNENDVSILKESWAVGVECELTRMIYPDYSRLISIGNYTGVVQDMIDGKSEYDQVSGYTIRQIEDALKGQRKFNDWKTNIKNKYNNGTENNLDALFDYWD